MAGARRGDIGVKIGLQPLAAQIADAAIEAVRAKKGAEKTHRRATAAVIPLVERAALIGLDQALIAARDFPQAVLAIEARKRELRGDA